MFSRRSQQSRSSSSSRRGAAVALAAAALVAAGCVQRASPPPPAGDSALVAPPSAAAPATPVVTPPRPAPDDPPTGGATPGDADAPTEIARLEREARALARTDGCTSGQCRTAPVGQRACGGPRTYLAYCAATTDSVALFRKLDALARAETDQHQRSGMASTCEFRSPPGVRAEGGRCVLGTTGSGGGGNGADEAAPTRVP